MGLLSKNPREEKKPHTTHLSKVQKHKRKYDNLIQSIQKKEIKRPQKTAPLDLTSLKEPIIQEIHVQETKKNKDKNVQRNISTKGKKYQLEREKKRFKMIVSDPFYKSDPMNAVKAYLEHEKSKSNNNKK